MSFLIALAYFRDLYGRDMPFMNTLRCWPERQSMHNT